MKVETLCEFRVGCLEGCKWEGRIRELCSHPSWTDWGLWKQAPDALFPQPFHTSFVIGFPPNSRTGMPILCTTLRITVNGPG